MYNAFSRKSSTKPFFAVFLYVLFSSKTVATEYLSLGMSKWGFFDSVQVSVSYIGNEFQTLNNFYQYQKIDLGMGFSAGYMRNSANLGYDVEFYTRFIGRIISILTMH